MNARFLRPFSRVAFRAPMAARSTMVRPALLALTQIQPKKTEIGSQQMVRLIPQSPLPTPRKKSRYKGKQD